MVIRVKRLVDACDTNSHGEVVRAAIVSALAVDDVVVLSFSGVSNATSSFVNSAFVDLLETMPFDEIKRRVRVIDASRQIIEMIKLRMTSEARRVAAAA
jgi:STAS-like domain of unknown function (DUF4325)